MRVEALTRLLLLLLTLSGCGHQVAYGSDRNMANMSADQLMRELSK